jgi:hypothetical protein
VTGPALLGGAGSTAAAWLPKTRSPCQVPTGGGDGRPRDSSTSPAAGQSQVQLEHSGERESGDGRPPGRGTSSTSRRAGTPGEVPASVPQPGNAPPATPASAGDCPL